MSDVFLLSSSVTGRHNQQLQQQQPAVALDGYGVRSLEQSTIHASVKRHEASSLSAPPMSAPPTPHSAWSVPTVVLPTVCNHFLMVPLLRRPR